MPNLPGELVQTKLLIVSHGFESLERKLLYRDDDFT